MSTDEMGISTDEKSYGHMIQTTAVVDPDMNAIGWPLASLREHNDENYLLPNVSSAKLIDTWRRELGGFPALPVDAVIHAYLLLRNGGDAQWLKPMMKELLAEYGYMKKCVCFAMRQHLN
ncbi:hypothetical protein [Roseomonas xinghualingensis]|uniref:hypothetical protein n=1 Tax=Roseomonas xinghualingensis TaxID=2986475 RepID=UPI0021F14160|nr:hypothetical protein [Roseomonas sp. SXEYE001]MCV4210420.1 hypothetical protein [Roseomonas sp. SXEYE001]